MLNTKRVAKYAFQYGCRYLGINRMSRWRWRHETLILCYHGVVAEYQADRYWHGGTVNVAEFERQLTAIRRYYHPISAADLMASYEGRAELPSRSVLVTFDDGYRNNLLLAAPVLERLGIPCVFHVATNYIGAGRTLWTDALLGAVLQWPRPAIPTPDGTPDVPVPSEVAGRRHLASRLRDICKRLPAERTEAYCREILDVANPGGWDEERFAFLSWDEVRTLHRKGFEIGSHTVDHPILTRISRSRLGVELQESKRRIETELGTPCLVIAYPNGGPGDFSALVMEEARRIGYRIAFTLTEEFNSAAADPLQLSRISVPGHFPPCVFEFRASGTERWLGLGPRQAGADTAGTEAR